MTKTKQDYLLFVTLAAVTNLAMPTRAEIVWMKGEPVRLPRGYARTTASNRRPKLCSDTLIDMIADMEPQRRAKQGSDGAAKHANNGAASEVRVVEQVEGSQAGDGKSGDGRLLDELKALRLQDPGPTACSGVYEK